MMKRAAASLVVLVFAILLVAPAGRTSGPAEPAAQSTLKPGEIVLQTIEPFSYVAVTRKGSFDQIPEAIGQLWEQMQAQNIAPTGPLIAIYHGDPALDAANLEFEIGFPVMDVVEIMEPPDKPALLAKKTWIFTTVAASLYVGPYDRAGEFILKMQDWIESKGCVRNGPVAERYMDMDPEAVPPDKRQTEIWIPCRTK